ncbi:hypothetical protein M378DRAFT_166420 [Amanita muscaria Koide BX008]|uniref:Uncharacterized protein n=1 Tax=Amanita muscaria (strain Koide BX008) TaxID=946122 RepID=A0A0C2T5D8_AMAMK|nr:hypothetical protein M378DRAFT_166420 [Amanita muscaria Koide BX008]
MPSMIVPRVPSSRLRSRTGEASGVHRLGGTIPSSHSGNLVDAARLLPTICRWTQITN